MQKINIHLTHAIKNNLFSIYLIPLGFIFLADAVLSYIFPILLEEKLKSQILMGVVMAFSSFVGIFCDLLFPEFLRKWRWPTIFLLGSILSLGFTFFAHLSIYAIPIFFGLFAVAFWGIYYELIIFSEERFIVNETDKKFYTRNWSIINSIIIVMWIVGPILGSQLLSLDSNMSIAVVCLFQFISIISATILFLKYKHHVNKNVASKKIHNKMHIFQTFKKWKIIFPALLPIILTTFSVKLIESAYWMFGALFAQTFSFLNKGEEFILLLSFTIPIILGTVFCGYENFSKNKKRLAEISLFTGGSLTAISIFIFDSFYTLLPLLFISNIFISFVGPLMSASSSEAQKKIKKENRFYIVGLVSFFGSLAYIVGPLLLGYISEMFGYKQAFITVAVFSVLSSIYLFIFTKK